MTEDNNSIGLNDIQIVVNIIDVCTKRGAFEGNELFAVGQVREKLAAFVKANLPPESAADADESGETDETEAA